MTSWYSDPEMRGDLERALEKVNVARRARAVSEQHEHHLDALLDSPSGKLVIYGTLAPGEVNHHVIADLEGTWQDGVVRGELHHVGWGAEYGYPAMRWLPRTDNEIPVKLFTSSDLPAHWPRLDEFEGDGYRRVLVPVERDGAIIAVANIYEVDATLLDDLQT